MTSTSAPTGLVLIDTVNEVFAEGGKGYPGFKAEFERIGTLDNLRRLLAGFRDKGYPAFFSPMSYTEEEYDNWKHRSGIHHMMFDNRMFEAGSWGAEFHPDLRPGPGDVTIAPHKNLDVFATTDLDIQLKRRGIEHIAVAGMIGTMCVESTARSAMERGYRVTLVKDATAPDGDADSYEQMVNRYALIAHDVLTTEELLSRADF
ncbi:cysteine hydrolase [Streptomyces sp. DH-12]|uniref:cysteine hydrolase family protein n=1 Tax=Streptomyces sp. DH-12 TaxID=2072509 RepID=UPI000CCF61C4|nr:cysteine hydrolase [Streptomyces sp. DH-12]PNV31928.1 cysteine hydrolase [Streptomyces sp. DH-12]